MKNCLKTYGSNLAHNRSRLWSVRMNGRRVATLQIGHQFSDPLITIRDMRASETAMSRSRCGGRRANG